MMMMMMMKVLVGTDADGADGGGMMRVIGAAQGGEAARGAGNTAPGSWSCAVNRESSGF